MIWLTLALMACITFFSRYLFLHKGLPFTVGPKAQRFLSFSAPAVLTAIWVPIVTVQDGQLALSLTNPYVGAAIVACLSAYFSRNIYITTLFGLASFFILKSVL